MAHLSVTFDIDLNQIGTYSDAYLATLWHVVQASPAPHDDFAAGDAAERIGREIIKRWLSKAPVEMWKHQGHSYYWSQLGRFASYTPGGPASDPAAFHSGQWRLDDEKLAKETERHGDPVPASEEASGGEPV